MFTLLLILPVENTVYSASAVFDLANKVIEHLSGYTRRRTVSISVSFRSSLFSILTELTQFSALLRNDLLCGVLAVFPWPNTHPVGEVFSYLSWDGMGWPMPVRRSPTLYCG